MKIFAWVVLGIILFIIFALVYYLVVGTIIFHYSFARQSLSKKALKEKVDKRLKDYKVDLCWWDKVKFKKVEISSFDGLKLVGYFRDNGSENVAIIVHGYRDNHFTTQQYCKFFNDKNYNILAVDNRAHGESEGGCITFGIYDKKDILSWINFLNQNYENKNIVVLGVSMGAAAVCMLSSEKLPQNVVAIISDCAFDNVDRQLNFSMRKYKFLRKIIKKHLYSYVRRIYNLNIYDGDVVRQVKNTKTPILYIHGGKDSIVSIDCMYNLYDATPKNLRDKFIVEDAEHANSYAISGVLFEKKISDFIKSRMILK